MRTAEDSRVVPPEQSIWSHHLLRGPRRGVTTGFGGPAALPVAEGSTTRTSAAYTDTRVLPLQQRVRLARREPIVILPTPERVTRTAG